jgi:anaerobic ribonucleoside-triphosphate reductase activating protein
MSLQNLNIANVISPVTTLGPGNRFAIWVQGCPFTCKGCISPDYIPFRDNKIVDIRELANLIIGSTIDGITISGGEPFAQAWQLAELLEIVLKSRPELNVLVFTGYEFSKLKSKAAKAFLSKIDLVITDLFVEELNSPNGLRGSDNQSFHYISDKLVNYKEEIENSPKKIETIIKNGMMTQVGIMSDRERKFSEELINIFNNI